MSSPPPHQGWRAHSCAPHTPARPLAHGAAHPLCVSDAISAMLTTHQGPVSFHHQPHRAHLGVGAAWWGAGRDAEPGGEARDAWSEAAACPPGRPARELWSLEAKRFGAGAPVVVPSLGALAALRHWAHCGERRR
ncbi:hypothetical protein PVAP13_1NG241738 [Panicum virgatum]|uniref:Uncharacterized protein n=1 Tax=Panicum virgatum TaxID=38727 RepID=A0A8T0WSV6_PANVG|nr:hypothetical protein PVAP13_1NG241738 [Panicum virgatum]